MAVALGRCKQSVKSRLGGYPDCILLVSTFTIRKVMTEEYYHVSSSMFRMAALKHFACTCDQFLRLS
jgi:hypothetical protein